MDAQHHDLPALFAQLGLAASGGAIAEFVEAHRPLPTSLRLSEARFWTPAQAQFIEQALDEDSDWCEAVDQLDAQLRH